MFGVRDHNRLKSRVQSVARNPLLFNKLYRMKLVERIGSGARRIRDAGLEHGVAEAGIQVSTDWVTVTFPRREVAIALHVTPHEAPHLTPHVRRLIATLQGETGRAELMAVLGLADRSHFLRTYLVRVRS